MRIKGKIIKSYSNKLLVEISEDDYVNKNFDDAEVIIEGKWSVNEDGSGFFVEN